MSDTFNPNQHLLQLKSRDGVKDYLPVQWRLVWFRQECPHGTIETEELEYDTEKECSIEAFVWNSEKRRNERAVKTAKGYARYRAVVTDGKGGRATGTKAECRANFEDYGEKAETGAIGRALAGLGFGTQFAPELNEEHRIVDSPVERGGAAPVEGNDTGNGRKVLATVRTAAAKSNGTSNGNGQSAAPAAGEVAADAGVTEQQLSSIRKLCEHLGKPEPEHMESMSFASARELIGQLSQEYRQSRSKAS